MLRALGIPARPITNFDSAHDTEANKTIDYYFDKDWNLIEDKSADSIWYALFYSEPIVPFHRDFSNLSLSTVC